MVDTNRAAEVVASVIGDYEFGVMCNREAQKFSNYVMVAQERLAFFSAMYEIDAERIHERALQISERSKFNYIDCIQEAAKELSGQVKW